MSGILQSALIPATTPATTPAFYANFLALDAYTSPSWITFSRSGNATQFDSTGNLTWAPSNVLLNSATLSTQTVAVTSGATNILSFSGTGSITYSGAASGTLSGTGVSNRVSVVLTMSTASLVLTVSGSVTNAQLERVTYQTSPRTYITTTSAAVYAPRYDYNPSTLVAQGLLIEESRANLLNFSETFATAGGTNNNWVDTNITRTSTNNLSPDGTNNALRITASSGNGTLISSAAVGSSVARTLSVWLRRVTGTGNIQYTLDNGGTWTTQAVTTTWTRYRFAATTANQQVGFRIVTSGDAIEIWGAQLEAGGFSTSYVPTAAAQVTRAADIATLNGVALTFAGADTGSVVAETNILPASTATAYIVANSSTRARLYYAANFPTLSATRNTTTVLVATVGGGGNWSTAIVRNAIGWSPTGNPTNLRSIVSNNGTVAGDTSAAGTETTLYVGSINGTLAMNTQIRVLAIYNIRLADATLKSKSVVGSAL